MTAIGLRSDNAYIGLAKQSVAGTAVAPSTFPRWLDGSSIEVDLKAEDVWEGDGSRRLSTIIKNRQMVKIKLVCNPRPVELGFLETATAGAGSDSNTAPAASTTLSGAGNTSGSTTVTLVANTGLTSSGSANLDINAGAATEEIVNVTTPGTGSGPYVYTITSSGTLKYTHSAAEPVITSDTHVITDQADGNWYSIEVSLGGTSGIIIRARDCKVESCKRSCKAGGSYLAYELEFVGIACLVQASPTSVTLENRQAFIYTQGAWTLDGSAGGDSPNVEMFDITTKNNLDTEILTEQITLAGLIFGNANVDMSYDVVMINGNRIALAYYGSTAGTTDSQTLGTGSLTLLFTEADNFHTLQYKILTLVYTKVGLPQPKKDGKHFKLAVQATSISNGGLNTYLLQTTLTNTQTSAYG